MTRYPRPLSATWWCEVAASHLLDQVGELLIPGVASKPATCVESRHLRTGAVARPSNRAEELRHLICTGLADLQEVVAGRLIPTLRDASGLMTLEVA